MVRWVVCVLVLTIPGLGLAAPRPTPLSAAAEAAPQLPRNIALGQALAKRTATEAELAELQALADRGLTAAREAVARSPRSPEASYHLGRWLLYAYRVVVTPTAAEGRAAPEARPRVVRGLADKPDEGLEALQRAAALAPTEADYAADYGAALLEAHRLAQADSVLESEWRADALLTPAQKVRVALLLSDVHLAQQDLRGAREWAYAALGALEENASAVSRLRALDQAKLKPAPPAAQQAPRTQIVPSPEDTAPPEEPEEGAQDGH